MVELAAEYDTQSGMDHSSVDFAGVAFSFGLVYLVVRFALALWVLNILFWMKVMGWAGACSREKDPPKENKNPYSVK